MVDMADKINDMDDFIERMKEKILARSEKHKGNKQSLHTSGLTSHFAEEIIELLDIKDDKIRKQIFNTIFSSWASLKHDELVDVANLCWMMDMAMDNDGWIHHTETPEPPQ